MDTTFYRSNWIVT